MLIQHIFLLLLSWPCSRAIEDVKPPLDDVFDQIATASENQRVPFVQSENPLIFSKSTKIQTTPSTIIAATIHYENSNGFVPMNEPTTETPNKFSEINTTKGNDNDDKSIDSIREEFGIIENDPAYSSEARMFFNLAGPRADRRSFDAQDGQSEFEILKVNNETPAIANYHDFYENMQSNLNRNRATNQGRYEEAREPATGRTIVQNNKRTKERIKNIEKYLTNYHVKEDRENTDSYKQYYNGYPSGNARPTNTQKEIFEPERVQTTFHQRSNGQNYDAYGETAIRQKTSTIPRSSYDDAITNARQKYSTTVSGKNRHSNPVVVSEPSDYKLDMKYGTQQVSAKVTSIDNQKSPKHRREPTEVQLPSQYNVESGVNGEDRYGQSYERSEDMDDYTEEDEYLEITEKPRRIYKSRRRPYSTENSRRLPKEHRGHITDDTETQDSRKNNSPTRSKLHRPKAKPSYWIEDDRGPASDEFSEERPIVVTSKPEDNSHVKSLKSKGVTNWSQVGPNIEVSHSNGFEIGQIDKPKLLLPVNLNLLPLANFDHSTALGNSQGFDFTNVPNFVTAAPIVSSQSPLLSTSQSIINSGHANTGNTPKNIQNTLNNNYGLSTAVPDIIVGQNTYQNPVQAVILPQMNVHNKFSSNLRSHYLPSTVTPMFAVTQTPNSNVQNISPTMNSIALQNFQTTPSSRNVNSISQNLHHFTVNPSVSPAVTQLLMPQPTLQSFPLLHGPYNANSNYNILVNPNGLHGQNVIQQASDASGTGQNSPTSTTTPQPNTISNNNFQSAETQVRKNIASNSNGQFVTTASFSVGNEAHREQSNTANDNKYYLPTNNHNLMNNYNNNNNNYYNGNQNNQHVARPQQQENFYHIYGDDQNSNGKIKTYLQTAQVVPAIIHHGNGIPINFNNPNYANVGGQLQGEQSMLNPNVVANKPRDQNQQILKAANDIFENTWKQLQQLQSNDDAGRRLPHQNVYRINDNIGSTSNTNGNTANALLPGIGVNSAKAHLPILPAQNVEIINPNMRPSPVDYTLVNPYATFNHYPAAVLTTPIPIFSTAANFLDPRPAFASTTPSTMNLQNYMDQLTQIGAQSNQVNKFQSQPAVGNHDNQRQVFNPIQFVPNVNLMKSQTMLNSQHTEPLPNQLNLVPVIPGGNFFKNSYGAQTELVKKPRLSSDLEKYAEEMFKESLKTIYSTHKWNNDRKLRGNYSSSELNDLSKLKSELQRFKASMPDTSKYPGKDELEGHHSENKVRTADASGRTKKKPELSIDEIEQLFKSDFKLNLPSSSETSHHGHDTIRHKNRPSQSHGSSRPGSSSEHSTDFRNMKHLSNYLTPPRLRSFISKSPFVDSTKLGKKRPGTNHSRYNSANGNTRPLPRPGSLVSRPASSPDASASNHVESGIKTDGHYRHHKRPGKHSRDNNDNYETNRYSSDITDYRSYPTFTTASSQDSEIFKHSSSEHISKTDYYDINHPRMHNLLGLLMKNKQLPMGSSQSLFRDEDDLRQYFDSENRRIHSEFYDGNLMNVQKKLDAPINMGPPVASPKLAQIRYYPAQGAA